MAVVRYVNRVDRSGFRLDFLFFLNKGSNCLASRKSPRLTDLPLLLFPLSWFRISMSPFMTESAW